jgi:MFS family permease
MSAPPETPIDVTPALLRHRSFVLYWCARSVTNGAYWMQAVAVGWQIYDLTGSALDLGLVGLVQFIPFVLLAVVVGPTIDRYDRRVVARACQIIKALAALGLAAGTLGGWLNRDAFLLILFVTGIARTFEVPTMHALVPGLVPRQLLPRAIAASSTASQAAVICGPALGGLLYVFGPATVYLICMIAFAGAGILVGLLKLNLPPIEKRAFTLETVFAGFVYLRSQPILLGAMSLDLFAVVFGGLTALLPIFARDILETGPWGLGLLRTAPAMGALAVAAWLANHSLERRAGMTLFAVTGVFGLSIIVFASSTSLLLSLAALAVYGAADATSVVIRHSLVQTRTPNDMLGRVMAINSMFTGSSGTLGEFRAGAVAALIGAFGSALIGGIGTLAVAALWIVLFPQLARIDAIDPVRVAKTSA